MLVPDESVVVSVALVILRHIKRRVVLVVAAGRGCAAAHMACVAA